MTFLNAKTTWTNAEFIPLKVCIGAAYLFIGTYFHAYFQRFYSVILFVFSITVIWTLYLWITKMRARTVSKPKKALSN